MCGGRSSGARVACRTAAEVGAAAVLCLAFPVHPPGRGDDPTKSRLSELDAVTVPTLVVQGERDRSASDRRARTARRPRPWDALTAEHCRDRRGGLRPAGKRRPRTRQGALTAHELTKQQARRIAVRAQMLDSSRPTDLIEVVRQLTMLQVDPTAAIAPSADIVAWSRLGSSYEPADLTRALEQDRKLFELDAMVRHMDDLGLYLAGATDFPDYERSRAWFSDNDSFRKDILKLLEKSGPLVSREIPDTCAVPWASSGWTNNRNVTQMLEFMMMRGEIAISARVGRERVWDLAERVYRDVDVPSTDEAERRRNERRLGVARDRAAERPEDADGAGPRWRRGRAGRGRRDEGRMARRSRGARPGLRGPDSAALSVRPPRPRSPPAQDLFEFEYVLEMYKPEAKRRWGYFALPILHEDRLVGKLDAKADRKASVLRVNAIHEDVKFTRATAKAVQAEVDDLASWLGLDAVAR